MLMHVNSRYRSPGDVFDNFNFNTNINSKFNKITLLDCNIPLSQNIFNSTNNIIKFSEGSNNFTATIPTGTYTISELVSTLPGLFNTSGATGTYATTYIDITGNITISSTSTFSLLFNATSPYYQLGFLNQTYGPGTTFTSTNAINLSPPPYLYIDISDLGIPNLKGFSSQPFLGTWPILLNGSSYTFSSWNNYSVVLPFTKSQSSFRIALRSADGNLSGIRNDWGFTALLS